MKAKPHTNKHTSHFLSVYYNNNLTDHYYRKVEKIKAVRLESGPKKSQGLSLNRSQIYSALRTYNTPTESQVVYK